MCGLDWVLVLWVLTWLVGWLVDLLAKHQGAIDDLAKMVEGRGRSSSSRWADVDLDCEYSNGNR